MARAARLDPVGMDAGAQYGYHRGTMSYVLLAVGHPPPGLTNADCLLRDRTLAQGGGVRRVPECRAAPEATTRRMSAQLARAS